MLYHKHSLLLQQKETGTNIYIFNRIDANCLFNFSVMVHTAELNYNWVKICAYSVNSSISQIFAYSTYYMIKCCYCNSAVGVCRLNSAHFQKIIIFEISSCTIIEASKRKAKQESICMLWKLNKVKNFHKNFHDFLLKRGTGR